MKKRVLVFSTAYLPLMGGAEVAVREITDRATDFEFDVVCARLRPGLASVEKMGNVTVHRIGFGTTFDKYLLPVVGALYGLRFKPDLLWSMQASYGGFASLFYSWMRPKTRFLLTLQEGDPFERYAKRAGPFNFLHKKIFQRADQIQAISHFLGQWAIKMGFEGKPVLIPNGVDLSRFTYHAPRVLSDEVRIISVSRLSHKNGLDLLIRALPSLPEHVKVWLVGDGEDRDMLEKLAQELGVDKRVRFLGSKTHDEVAKLFQECDMFCRPSRTEGLGNSFLEAMAAGLPTIGTPVGGIPDFLNVETGWLCAPENPESITETVNRILATPHEERSRITQSASRLVRERYDWDKIARDMGDTFTRVEASRRILIATGIYPPDIGGPATYVPLLSRGLVEAGDRVRVVTFGNEKTKKGDGWKVSVVSTSGSAPIRYARMFGRVLHLAKRMDVVYAMTPSSDGFPASLAAKLRRKPFMLKVVGDYAWEAYRNGLPATAEGELLDDFLAKRHGGSIGILEKMERFVAEQARLVIVPSAYLGSVVGRWGVASSRIRRIYNAVATHKATRERDILRKAFGIESKRVLFTVVRCVPWKGVDFLIELLPKLPPDTILVVAGDGPMKVAWEKLAALRGVSGRVRFLGSVTPVIIADWNAASDAFVLASAYEGYPHVVVEALAAGRPCFVTDKAGNKEMGALAPSGVTVLPYHDERAWVEALSRPFVPFDPSHLKLQTVEAMVAETRSVLHDVCASSH
ncbi:glycosyltransferase family 4 protein [Patescibacteria group bacterium]|jgi:glycosyltransferase involved in cell wall biosynthesis|nr:glycosyltransferase family 4 protein [Patescibacteria group bacterium]